MESKLKTIWEMFRIYRTRTNMGDVAALKLTLLSDREEDSPYTEGVLQTREESFSVIDFEGLDGYPEGSFGRAFADFMRRNRLDPLNLSDRSRPLFDRYPVSIRYVRVHDMFHVLLGFETDMVGELGVYAFVGEQGYNSTLNRAARTARTVGRLMFWARTRIHEAEARGGTLGRLAPPLIAQPLESMLPEPLEDVRRHVGLAD